MRKTSYKKILYNGQEYTLKQLSKIHGVAPTAINNRLLNGWNIEDAISTPSDSKKGRELPPEFQNGNKVYCVFRRHIPGVYNHMQPTLNKPYLLKAYESNVSAATYTITLENGKTLIVRKGEFQIIKSLPTNKSRNIQPKTETEKEETK